MAPTLLTMMAPDDCPVSYLLSGYNRLREFIPRPLQKQKSLHHHQHVHSKPGRCRYRGFGTKHASDCGDNYQTALGVRTQSVRGVRVFHHFIVYSVCHVSWNDRHQPIFLHRQVEHLQQHILEEKSTVLRSRSLGCLHISGIPSTFRLVRI